MIERVVRTITTWGREGGYFADDAEEDAFADELRYILVTQRAAFNSPVWFNIGVPGVRQQASACFILSVDDTMNSILNWYREEESFSKVALAQVSTCRRFVPALSCWKVAARPRAR